MSNYFSVAMAALPRHMDKALQARSPAHLNYYPTFPHPSPLRTFGGMSAAAAQQPPSSRACRRTAAGAELLPGWPDGARIGGSGLRGWSGSHEARSDLWLPAVRMVASWAVDMLCRLLGWAYAHPKASYHRPYHSREQYAYLGVN